MMRRDLVMSSVSKATCALVMFACTFDIALDSSLLQDDSPTRCGMRQPGRAVTPRSTEIRPGMAPTLSPSTTLPSKQHSAGSSGWLRSSRPFEQPLSQESHCSPKTGLVMPSPHVDAPQQGPHVSRLVLVGFTVLPSSHCSLPPPHV